MTCIPKLPTITSLGRELLNKWRPRPVHALENNTVKTVVLSNWSKSTHYQNSSWLPLPLITEIDKLILKFVWNCKEPRIVNNLEKEEKS